MYLEYLLESIHTQKKGHPFDSLIYNSFQMCDLVDICYLKKTHSLNLERMGKDMQPNIFQRKSAFPN